MTLLHETESVCPTCRGDIKATVVREYGSVYIVKSCAEHGEFRTKIAQRAWYYQGLHDFYNKLMPPDFERQRQCRSYALFVTSRCNLNCPICFTDANVTHHVEELSLDAISRLLDEIRGQGKLVRLSGGEPTLHPDLPRIVELIERSGNASGLFTNGLQLDRPELLEELRLRGLRWVVMWIDSLHREEVNLTVRGRPLIEAKRRALASIRRARIPFLLYHVKVKGVNDPDTADLWRFALESDFVRAFWIKGYAHLGKKQLSRENEFLVDDLLAEVAQVTGAFTLEDIYCYQKLCHIASAVTRTPWCYYGQNMIVPRRQGRRLELARLSDLLDKFERRHDETSLEAALRYLYPRLTLRLARVAPVLLAQAARKRLTPPGTFFDPSAALPGHMLLIISTFYDAHNYDRRQMFRQCPNGAFHLGPGKNIPLCEQNVRCFG